MDFLIKIGNDPWIRSDTGSRDKAAEPMVLLPADLAQPLLYFGQEQPGQMR